MSDRINLPVLTNEYKDRKQQECSRRTNNADRKQNKGYDTIEDKPSIGKPVDKEHEESDGKDGRQETE